MALEDPRNVIRWLLAPRNQRELEVLELLKSGELRAPELQDQLNLEHPQPVYRSLEYLQDRGLVSRFQDLSEEQRGATYEVSPIGSRVLEAVHDVQELLSERQVGVERAVVEYTATGVSVRTGRRRREEGDVPLPSEGETVHLTDTGGASLEIGSFSEGSPDDEVVMRA